MDKGERLRAAAGTYVCQQMEWAHWPVVLHVIVIVVCDFLCVIWSVNIMNQYYLLVHCLLSLLTSQVILQIPVSWIPVFQTLFSALFSFGFHSSIFHNTHIHFLRFFYLSNIFDSFNPNRHNHSPLNFMRFIWAIWINTYFNLYNKIYI